MRDDREDATGPDRSNRSDREGALGARTRRGAHRARPEPLRVIVPAVALVAVVGAGAAYVSSGDDPARTATASTRTQEQPAAATPTPRPSAVDTPEPTDDETPAVGPAQDDADPEQAEPTAGPTDSEDEQEEQEEEGDGGGTPDVVVLNQTSVKGLAADLGEGLRADGWSVTRTGNFRGTVPSTTVYYPEGMREEAERVAADLPGPARVRPAFSNISRSGLTVVVTEDIR